MLKVVQCTSGQFAALPTGQSEMREEPTSVRYLIDCIENGCNLILIMDRSQFFQALDGRHVQSGGRSVRQMRNIIMATRANRLARMMRGALGQQTM